MKKKNVNVFSVRCDLTMPKEGLPHAEWLKRLPLYANGEYQFGRGKEKGINRGMPSEESMQRHFW